MHSVVCCSVVICQFAVWHLKKVALETIMTHYRPGIKQIDPDLSSVKGNTNFSMALSHMFCMH